MTYEEAEALIRLRGWSPHFEPEGECTPTHFIDVYDGSNRVFDCRVYSTKGEAQRRLICWIEEFDMVPAIDCREIFVCIEGINHDIR